MKFEVRRHGYSQNLNSGPPRDMAEMSGGTAGVCALRRHLLRLHANRSWASAPATLAPRRPGLNAPTRPDRRPELPTVARHSAPGPAKQILLSNSQNRCGLRRNCRENFTRALLGPLGTRPAPLTHRRSVALRTAAGPQRQILDNEINRRRFLPLPRGNQVAPVSMPARSADQIPVGCSLFHQCPASLFDSSTIRSSGLIPAATTEQLPVHSRTGAASIQVSIGCGGSQPVFIDDSIPRVAREWLFRKARAGDELVNEFKFVQ